MTGQCVPLVVTTPGGNGPWREVQGQMDRSVVLVTGASRGIGQATTALLAAQGYQVFGTATKLSGKDAAGFEMLPLDVTSDESVAACVSRVPDRAGRIDVLINNAGVGLIGAIEETPVEQARGLFDANLFGTARMISAVLPGMRQHRNRADHQLRLAGRRPAGPLPRLPVRVQGRRDHLLRRAPPGGETPGHRGHRRRAGHRSHAGERVTQLKAAGVIRDYAEQEARAVAVMEQGQRAGASPRQWPDRPADHPHERSSPVLPGRQRQVACPAGRGSCRHRRSSR